MDSFCNGTPFWDTNLTWTNASWPQFTECFQDTVLIWIPSGWLLLTSPIYLWYLFTRPTAPLPLSWKSITKTILCVLLLVLLIIVMVTAVQDLEMADSYWKAHLIGPVLQALSILFVMVYIQLERWKGFVTSGVLFLYWTLANIIHIIPTYTKFQLKEYDTDTLGFVIFFMYYFIAIVQWILQCFPETMPGVDPKVTKELTSSFLSRLTFSWMDKLMLLGYRKPLTEEDMYLLHPRDRSRTCVPVFAEYWRTEAIRIRCRERKKKNVHIPVQSLHNNEQNVQSETTPLLSSPVNSEAKPKEDKSPGNSKAKPKEKPNPGPSLLKLLIKTFGWDLLQAHFFKLLYDGLVFVNPLLLRLLIGFVSDMEIPQWKGYLYAACFLW
ncbi:hypothetical protein ScPMuIL_012248 [Solemya velum]